MLTFEDDDIGVGFMWGITLIGVTAFTVRYLGGTTAAIAMVAYLVTTCIGMGVCTTLNPGASGMVIIMWPMSLPVFVVIVTGMFLVATGASTAERILTWRTERRIPTAQLVKDRGAK